MCLVGKLGIIRGLCVFFAQIVGGIAAAGVVDALLPGEMSFRTSLSDGMHTRSLSFSFLFCFVVIGIETGIETGVIGNSDMGQ